MAVQHITEDELFDAISRDQIEDVQYLISQGVRLDTKDVDGRSPLVCSVMEKSTRCLQALLDGGAQAKSDFAWVCLEASKEFLELLLPKVQSEEIDFAKLYLQMIYRGRIENLRLLENHFKHKACDEMFRYDQILALLEKGSDHQRYLYQYLTHEIDMPEQNLPLCFLATAFECTEIIETLDDLSPMNSAGETPLHWAAISGYAQLVDLFILKGVDINLKNKNNKTVLDLIEEYGYFLSHRLILKSLRQAQK